MCTASGRTCPRSARRWATGSPSPRSRAGASSWSWAGCGDDRERVFLLSTTHGAETHALAAALAVIGIYRDEAIVERLEDRGRRLRAIVEGVVAAHGLSDHVQVLGRPSNLVFATLDADGQRSQPFRTLFLQGLVEGGVLGPSFVVSAALSDEDLERTGEAVDKALTPYAAALDGGIERWLRGRPVKPVMRPFA